MEGESAHSMLQSVSGLMSNMEDNHMSYDSSYVSFQHEVSSNIPSNRNLTLFVADM